MIINKNGASVTSTAFISVEREDAAKGLGGRASVGEGARLGYKGECFGEDTDTGGARVSSLRSPLSVLTATDAGLK